MTRAEAIRMLLTIVEECEKHGDRNGGGCRECPFGCGAHCLAYFKGINPAYNGRTRFDTLKRMLDELEQEQRTGDLISKDKVIDILDYWYDKDSDGYVQACKSISELQ